MAQFHVGQRVCIVRPTSIYFSCEATILGVVYEVILKNLGPVNVAYWVDIDKVGCLDKSGFKRGYAAKDLAPLTDPPAERFIESIKRLGREPTNVAPKERVTR